MFEINLILIMRTEWLLRVCKNDGSFKSNREVLCDY